MNDTNAKRSDCEYITLQSTDIILSNSMNNTRPTTQYTLNNDAIKGLRYNMHQAGYQDFKITSLEDLVKELSQNGVRGIDKFLKILSQRLSNDEEEYFDILREGRFTQILVRNGFKQVAIEHSQKGPDVKATYNRRTVYFEITRKRENEEDRAIHQSKEGVGWISPYRLENILSTIQDELRQLEDGELNIVVIWGDTITLSRHLIEKAIDYIQQEIKVDPNRYSKLSGVLFTIGRYYDTKTNRIKQFNLFKNDKAQKQLPSRLANKLERMTDEDNKNLLRDHEDLAARIQQDAR